MPAKLTVATVTASGHDENLPLNTIDGDTGTRWSAKGDGQWIQWDLGSVQRLAQVRIAFFEGDSRINTFDINVSDVSDGTPSTRVLERHTSSGASVGFETFDFGPVSGRFVRYTGHGSNVGLWNSLTEAELWSPDGPAGPAEAAVRFGWGTPLAQWSDEFTYTGAPDPAKWTVSSDAGPAGRRRPERVAVDGTKLVGTANAAGDHFALMSRLARQYGRWEVRARSSNVGSPPSSGQTLGVGGVATPAGAIVESGDRGALNITSGGTAANPQVYDGKGFTCGRITIKADNVVVQNYRINANGQYGAVLDADNITFQNNDIRNVRVSGDGDLNAITAWGDNISILYNTAVNFVSGDPGDSHTDFIQTWVSSGHPKASTNWKIIGNKATGPANPSRDHKVTSIHQCIMAEGFGRGGNSGGNGGDPSNWLIADNEFGDSWNQTIKLDGVDNVKIARNKFIGSSDKIMEVTDASSSVTFYADNTVGAGYSSVGYPVTPGQGPTTPGAAGGGTTPGHYGPYLGIWSDVTPWPTDGEYDFLANKTPGEQIAGADLRYPSAAAIPPQVLTPPPTEVGVDLTQFHNFGFEWTPTGLTGYLDGRAWFTATGGAISGTRRDLQTMSAGHLAIVLNNFTGLSMQPAQFEVEWVRIYEPAPASG